MCNMLLLELVRGAHTYVCPTECHVAIWRNWQIRVRRIHHNKCK